MRQALLPLLFCVSACAPAIVGDDATESSDVDEGSSFEGPGDGDGELEDGGEQGNNDESDFDGDVSKVTWRTGEMFQPPKKKEGRGAGTGVADKRKSTRCRL